MSAFRVFNRWGELLFERSGVALNDERAGWDGTYKGLISPDGTYTYKITYVTTSGIEETILGHINLFK